MIYVLFAILCGVTNVLSRSVNFVLSDKIGMYQSTFFNYVFGLAGSILILLISGETFKLFSASSYNAPWYIYAADRRKSPLQLGCGNGRQFRGAVCLLPGQPVKLADPALPEEVYHRIYDDHDCSEDRTFGAELCLVFKETQPELYPGGWVLRDLLCPVRIHGGVQLEHHVAGLHSSVPTDRIRP